MGNQSSPVPIYYLEGDAEERGHQYGSQAKALIEEGLELYRGLFKQRLNLEWEKALEAVKKFVLPIQKVNPQAIDQMKGIAKGSGQSFEEILILNARSELAYSQYLPPGVERPGEECLSIVATPEVTLDGHMIIGKNKELGPPMDRQEVVLLKERRRDGLNVVAFEQEAGVLARAGINAAGLGIVGTALWTDRMAKGIPNQVLCNKLIYSKTVVEALLAIAAAERASSFTTVIASVDGTASMIEWGTKAYNCILPKDGLLIGSLYCTVDNSDIHDMIDSRFPVPGGRDFYRMRANTVRRLFLKERGHITIDTFKRVLRDHTNAPASACIHADNPVPTGSHTLCSLIIDLTAKTMEIAKGNPCQSEYFSIDLSDVL